MLMWKTIPYCRRYEVSDEGQVRHRLNSKVRKTQRSDSGYLRVTVTRPHCLILVHKAVCTAFHGEPPTPRHKAAHCNGNRDDNRASNLEWKLPEENEADKKRHGTAPKGASPHGIAAPLSRNFVEAILYYVEAGYSYTRVARIFHVHRHTVSRICRGQRHKAVSCPQQQVFAETG